MNTQTKKKLDANSFLLMVITALLGIIAWFGYQTVDKVSALETRYTQSEIQNQKFDDAIVDLVELTKENKESVNDHEKRITIVEGKVGIY